MKDNRPDNAVLPECVAAAALNDWRVTDVQLVQVDTSHVHLVVSCFKNLVRQRRMFHSLHKYTQRATTYYVKLVLEYDVRHRNIQYQQHDRTLLASARLMNLENNTQNGKVQCYQICLSCTIPGFRVT